jgi:hypothetical protein
MSTPDDRKTALVEQRSAGYGHPPEQHRFQKGRSGNPRGRPRKKKAQPIDPILDGYIGDLILVEAMRPVQIKENGEVTEMPMAQAIIRSLNVSALKGNHRAQVAATAMLKATQDRVLDGRRAVYEAAVEYKREYRQVFAECDRRGEPRPDPIPHPDEIAIDEKTLEVRFNGPQSHDEKAHWDMMLARKAEFKEERDELRNELRRGTAHAAHMELEMEQADFVYRLIDQTIPDEKTRRQPGFDVLDWRRRKYDPTLKRPTSK